LSKQGNSFLRFLWGETAMHAARKDPNLKRFYPRKRIQKGLGKARMAAARKLGMRLWIMMATKLIMKSSVAADRCDRKTVVPMREYLKATLVLKIWREH
jgi:hypothetical protein